MVRVRADGVAGDERDRLAQQVVLDRAQRGENLLLGGRGRQLDGALQDDPAGVDAVVDEVHGDAEHLHAVVERLPDGADAREGRQQRRVDVHDALEATQERRLEQLHITGQDDELDAAPLDPARHGGVAPCAIKVIVAREDGDGYAGRGSALKRRRARLVRGDGDDLDAMSVYTVQDGLQV